MATSLQDDIKEILGIVKQCPEALQEKCFELLLNDLLAARRGQKPPKPPAETVPQKHGAGDEAQADTDDVPAVEQEDIQDGDLHVKARSFLRKYSLTVADLNQILYKEGDQFLPLYDDLKTTRASESQIRIGLLQALTSGLSTGEFQFGGEAVRSECQERKCYDGGNFTANLKNNATLFDSFEKYDKKRRIRLSEDGKKELAELIRELQ